MDAVWPTRFGARGEPAWGWLKGGALQRNAENDDGKVHNQLAQLGLRTDTRKFVAKQSP